MDTAQYELASLTHRSAILYQLIVSQEKANEKKVADETTVKMYAQLPPVEKMDAALQQLAHVEYVTANSPPTYPTT